MHGVMRQRFTLYSIAALFSILLSLWAAIKTSVINPDGICYLQSAAAMDQGLLIAAHLCDQAKWPLYSILIFGLVKLTNLSYLTAAYVLNGFFSLITVTAFIAIINTLTTKTRVLWLAAAVILLAHEFNSIRTDIVRDHGFWAFYLLSLLYFLRYFHASISQGKCCKRACIAVLWGLTLLTAGLFRIEGVMFLLLLPFVIFFDVRQTMGKRLVSFVQLNAIPLFGAVIALCWTLLHPDQHLSRLTEVQFQLLHGVNQLVTAFSDSAHRLAVHVLSVYSAHDASVILVGMLAAWYVTNAVSNVSLIYAILIVYAWLSKAAQFDRQTRLALGAYILVNVLITIAFLVDNMFLAKRYLIALSLVLMLWVPFALDALITQWQTRKWPLVLAVFFIAVYAFGGIFDFGYSKKYVRQAGDWLAAHTADDVSIYSNDYQLLYYANHMGNAIFTRGREFENLSVIAHGKWRQYDYIALRVSKNESAADQSVLREINLTPVVVFQNARGDQVRIYQVHLNNGVMERKR